MHLSEKCLSIRASLCLISGWHTSSTVSSIVQFWFVISYGIARITPSWRPVVLHQSWMDTAHAFERHYILLSLFNIADTTPTNVECLPKPSLSQNLTPSPRRTSPRCRCSDGKQDNIHCRQLLLLRGETNFGFRIMCVSSFRLTPVCPFFDFERVEQQKTSSVRNSQQRKLKRLPWNKL